MANLSRKTDLGQTRTGIWLWVNNFLHNYGLTDNDLLTTGEVEELCEDMIREFIKNNAPNQTK